MKKTTKRERQKTRSSKPQFSFSGQGASLLLTELARQKVEEIKRLNETHLNQEEQGVFFRSVSDWLSEARKCGLVEGDAHIMPNAFGYERALSLKTPSGALVVIGADGHAPLMSMSGPGMCMRLIFRLRSPTGPRSGWFFEDQAVDANVFGSLMHACLTPNVGDALAKTQK